MTESRGRIKDRREGLRGSAIAKVAVLNGVILLFMFSPLLSVVALPPAQPGFKYFSVNGVWVLYGLTQSGWVPAECEINVGTGAVISRYGDGFSVKLQNGTTVVYPHKCPYPWLPFSDMGGPALVISPLVVAPTIGHIEWGEICAIGGNPCYHQSPVLWYQTLDVSWQTPNPPPNCCDGQVVYLTNGWNGNGQQFVNGLQWGTDSLGCGNYFCIGGYYTDSTGLLFYDTRVAVTAGDNLEAKIYALSGTCNSSGVCYFADYSYDNSAATSTNFSVSGTGPFNDALAGILGIGPGTLRNCGDYPAVLGTTFSGIILQDGGGNYVYNWLSNYPNPNLIPNCGYTNPATGSNYVTVYYHN